MQVLHGLAALRGKIGGFRRLGGDGFKELRHRDAWGRFHFFNEGPHAIAERDVWVEGFGTGGADKQFATPAFEDLESPALEGPAEFLGHDKRAGAGDIGRDPDQTEQVGLDGVRVDIAGHGGGARFLDGTVGVMSAEMGFHFGAGSQDQADRQFFRRCRNRDVSRRRFLGLCGGFTLAGRRHFRRGRGRGRRLGGNHFGLDGGDFHGNRFDRFGFTGGLDDLHFARSRRLCGRGLFGLGVRLGRTGGGIL